MAYQLEGRLLEVCSCNILCPCWVGGDPDGDGTCQAIVAWHIDKGTIDGVNVGGLTFALLANIPGNVLKGNWRVVAIVDDKATPQQQEAILNVWTGKRGGPVADLAKLVGEVAGVERVPVTFTVEGGKGRVKIGALAEAEMSPLLGANNRSTTLNDSVFTTIPGAPAYVSKASYYRSNVPALGINLNLSEHNAVQGDFRFVA
ncbi:MAG TPA: DUF1326 domain-containing protein [Anaerolineales bacterium]|nr:DUF1326 domain-containing protein [Anaerolineales bacterium]